jgi:FMN phosphatase YigB (HAD superfamily)
MLPELPDLTYLIDVDDTLLDNDVVVEDLKRHLVEVAGADGMQRYWDIFEVLFRELGYADYLGAFQRFRIERPRDEHLWRASLFLLQYPFAERLYPGALEALSGLRRRAPVVILSDGDAVAQPNKIERSGLWRAVDGNVLIYVHKEEMLDDVERRYPARRYVMVDDKIRILAAMKASWGERLTTVFVRQGHYALDPSVVGRYPKADITVDRIGDLVGAVSAFDPGPRLPS